EWIKRGACADSTISTDGAAGDEAAFVEAGIFACNHVGSELGVSAQIERTADCRAEDARAGSNTDSAVKINDAVGVVFEPIHEDAGELHWNQASATELMTSQVLDHKLVPLTIEGATLNAPHLLCIEASSSVCRRCGGAPKREKWQLDQCLARGQGIGLGGIAQFFPRRTGQRRPGLIPISAGFRAR